MTNPDTNTLNGSLEQLGITLATNLTAKNVTASASDGLTTLAGKITSIPSWDYYDSQTVDKNRYTVTSQTANLTYTNDGFTAIGTANDVAIVENNTLTLPSQYILKFDVTNITSSTSGSTTYYGGLIIDNLLIDFEGARTVVYSWNPINHLYHDNTVLHTGDTLKIIRFDGKIYIYINNTLFNSQSRSNLGLYAHRVGLNRGLTIKNLKMIQL